MINNILTFDIEDNFAKSELKKPSDWERYEGQVEENTHRILEMLRKYEVTATFFVLGKVAARRPNIVHRILSEGHEIASHGYIHEKVDNLGPNGFVQDLEASKKIIEQITQKPLLGYRAMAFSINQDTGWALQQLSQQGFSYDSSILSSRLEGDQKGFESIENGEISEICPSSFKLFGKDITSGGGLFFRIAPFFLVQKLIDKTNRQNLPFVCYSHAWEFNIDHPKRKVSFAQSLAQSSLTFTTQKRLQKLLQKYKFTSISNYLSESYKQ